MKKKLMHLFACVLLAGSNLLAQGTAVNQIVPAEKSIQLSTGVTLKYVEQGSKSAVPVILVHGFTDSWHSYEMVLPHLPKSLHVFALSVRGHGNSSKPAGSYGPKVFADDIAEFMKKKKISQAVIVGHSMGATITQCFAVNYPELTKAIVLVATFADYNKPMIAEFTEVINQLKDPIDTAFIAEFQHSTIVKPVSENMIQKFISESTKVPAQVWQGVAAGWKESGFLGVLNQIDKPALILWGDKDAYCSRDDQEALLKSIKGAKLVIYENTGHAIHWEESEKFAKDLTGFINRVNQ